jgi:hypothetical protein
VAAGVEALLPGDAPWGVSPMPEAERLVMIGAASAVERK